MIAFIGNRPEGAIGKGQRDLAALDFDHLQWLFLKLALSPDVPPVLARQLLSPDSR